MPTPERWRRIRLWRLYWLCYNVPERLRWRWQKVQTGIDDLVINEAGRSLELPETFGRHERITVSLADIEDFSVEQIVHRSSKGGISYTYAPTLRLRGPQAGEQKLVDWSDKVKADDFAAWLRTQLGR